MDAETIVNSLLTAIELVAASLLFASGLPRRGGYLFRGLVAVAALATLVATFMPEFVVSSGVMLFPLILLYALVLALFCLVVASCH